LTGKKAKGAIGGGNSGEVGTLELEFLSDKKVRARAIGKTSTGQWFEGSYIVQGNRITMTIGASTFEGTIDGKHLSGTRQRRGGKSRGTNDNWSVSLQD
jgi:hypothetical protein